MDTITTPNDNAERKKKRLQTFVLGGILVVSLLLALGGGLLMWSFQSSPLQKQFASVGGPFILQATDGRTVTDRDFRGKYALIYFGYTFCPDVCPTTMANLTAALPKLGAKADEIQPIFITVDPRRDTVDVLKSYMAAFSPRLLGLTGSEQEIKKVEQEYKVYVGIHRTGLKPDDYSIDHSSAFYLMGPDGKFIALLRADQEGDSLAADIAQHLS